MLVLLNASRVINYMVYADYYQNKASLFEIMLPALMFDLQTCGYLLTIPILLILFPTGNKFKLLKSVGLNLGFVVLLVAAIALFADTLYFGIVNRHAFRDALLLMTELDFVLPLLLSNYLLPFVAGLVALVAAIALWLRYLQCTSRWVIKPARWSHQLSVLLVSIFLLLICIRGFDIEGKPQSMIDAYIDHNEQQANLVLNGVYTSIKGLTASKKSRQYHFVDNLEQAQPRQFKAFSSTFSDNTPNDRNLFIILVEALSYEYIDALAGTSYGATPFLDQLAKKSEVYDNFYAVGQRSYYGMQGILFGIPPLDGIGYIGGGLELSRLSKIGDMAAKHGYYTQMLQSSNRDSIRLNSIANYAGFDTYLGRSDIPVTRTDYPNPEAAQFGWDYEMLMKTLSLVNQQSKPFLSFSFTGTMHMPYAEPPKQWQIYRHGEDRMNDFLNTVRYTDQSLREFFALAEQQPWFKQTTFMIMADHTLFNAGASLKKSFHIPLFIYRPGQGVAPTRHKMMASQLDILPTVIDLLGFDDSFSAMGQSLYRAKDDYSIIVKGNLFGAFTKNGNFLTAGEQIVHQEGSTEFVEQEIPTIEKQMKYKFQKAQRLILDNQWATVEQ
ncbi:MAG: LTA synthase family protein [Gammaproteobacteria bacterium]|nr:LTA synthase family protein [Gammaproteobacteria bacterium]